MLSIKILNRIAVFFISSYLILTVLFIKYYKIKIIGNSKNQIYQCMEIHFNSKIITACGINEYINDGGKLKK